MNDFTRNLNQHFKQHRTLYAEEGNVANKEKVEDRRGLYTLMIVQVDCIRQDILYIFQEQVGKMEVSRETFWMTCYCCLLETPITQKNTEMQWNFKNHQKLMD